MSVDEGTLKVAISAISAIVAVVGAIVSWRNVRETRRETFKARLVGVRLLIVENGIVLGDVKRRIEAITAALSRIPPQIDNLSDAHALELKAQVSAVDSRIAEARRVFGGAAIATSFTYSKAHSEELYRLETNEGALGKFLGTASTELSTVERECEQLGKA